MLGLISGSHPDPPAFAICQALRGPSPISAVWVAVCASMCQHALFGPSWVLDLLAHERLCWSTAQWLSRRVSINRPYNSFSIGRKLSLGAYRSDKSMTICWTHHIGTIFYTFHTLALTLLVTDSNHLQFISENRTLIQQFKFWLDLFVTNGQLCQHACVEFTMKVTIVMMKWSRCKISDLLYSRISS